MTSTRQRSASLASRMRLLAISACAGTDGDAVRPHAVVAGGMQDQSAPAAADIEQILPRLQAQFAAEIIEFALLSGFQGFLGGREIGAGINHALIEPETEKIVGLLVMVTDRLRIALFRMDAPAARRRALPADLTGARQAPQIAGQPKLFAPAPVETEEAVGQGEAFLDITLDIEIVMNIGFPQGQLIGGEKHQAQGAGVFQNQRAARAGGVFPQRSVP